MTRPIEYTVVLAAPQTQTLELRMLVRNVKAPFLDVAMPAWRQGRYVILDPAGTVSNVRAADPATGTELAIKKIAKAMWRIMEHESLEGSTALLPSRF